MAYFHNKFNKVDKTAIYQFVKYLEEMPYNELDFGWHFNDEFRRLRQIINFAYTHGFRDDIV